MHENLKFVYWGLIEGYVKRKFVSCEINRGFRPSGGNCKFWAIIAENLEGMGISRHIQQFHEDVALGVATSLNHLENFTCQTKGLLVAGYKPGYTCI